MGAVAAGVDRLRSDYKKNLKIHIAASIQDFFIYVFSFENTFITASQFFD